MSDKLNDLAIFLDGQIEKLEKLKYNHPKQEKRGGKRNGAGRPKKEPTTTIRVPFKSKATILRWTERKNKINTNTSQTKKLS